MKVRNKKDLKFLVVSRSIIKKSDGKIIILKRSFKHIYYPQKWELPGGRLASHEDPHASTSQIIHRETGLITEARSKKFYTYSRLVTEPGKYQGYVYLEIVSESELVGGKEKIDKNEHLEYVWVDPGSAPNYDLTFESKKAIASYLADKSGAENAYNTSAVLVARALVEDKMGRYLFLKRSNSEEFSGTWELPGGKFDSLEILPELIKREVFEETGLAVRVVNEALYLNSIVSNKGENKGKTYINIIGKAEIVAGKIELTDEHNDYKWVTKREIFRMNLAPYLRLPLTEIFLKS